MAKLQRINRGDLKSFRIGFWDLEASGLEATFGGLFCGTVKELGRDPVTYRIDKGPGYSKAPWDDKWLCTKLRDELEGFQVLVGYNSIGWGGRGFDLPFLNTRLVHHKERILSGDVKHVDLFLVTRMRMRLHSNRLEALLQHLETRTRKTPLRPEDWRRAAAGDERAMDRIVAHNIPDVISLEEAFLRLIPFLDISFRLVR